MPSKTSPLVGSWVSAAGLPPSGIARPTVLGRLLIPLLALTVTLAAAAEARTRYKTVSLFTHHPRPNIDLAIRANPSGSFSLFTADADKGGIYSREIEAKKDVESWDLQSFARLEMKGTQVSLHPTALAVHGNSLFVLDRDEEAVFAVDLNTHVSRLLLRKPAIDKPLTIAVSDGGILAIGQDNRSVLLYDPAKPEAPLASLQGTFDEPLRMQFLPNGRQQPDSLLVLDGDHADHLTLYEPSAKQPGEYDTRPIQVPPDVLGRLERRIDTTLDFAFVGESFYLTEGYNWAIFSLNGLTSSRWMIFPDMYKVSPARIRSVGDYLFVLDPEHRHVLRLSLSLMTLRIEANASEANAFLADLYQDLWDKGSLPERIYRVPQHKKTLLEILKLEHVLAPADDASTFTTASVGGARPDAPADKLENILCLLNRRLNGWQCPPSSPPPPGTEKLNRHFGLGQALVIPGLGVEQTRYESSVQLLGRSVEAALKDRLMTDNPHEGVSTEYLMRINPSYYRTLEYEMTRRGYILITQTSSPGRITPGTLVKVTQSGETLNVSPNCQNAWPELTGQAQNEPVASISEKLRLFVPSLDYLPRTEAGITDQAVLSEWARRGVANVEMIFERPTEERASRQVLAAGAPPQCWTAVEGRGTYLASDVLNVSGVKYRLLRQDGKVVPVKPEDLVRWGMAGVVDESGEWSVIVQTPFTLAYRAIPWDGQPIARGRVSQKRNSYLPEPDIGFVLDPHDIKPGSAQDIWTKTNGKFVLPGYRWEVKLLTDSTLLADGSVIRKWAARNPDKVFVWPATGGAREDTKPATITDGSGGHDQQEDLTQVTTNRGLLRKAISYPSEVNSGDITIGLMERTNSIEELNPDFAWRKVEEEGCDTNNSCSWEFVWLEPSDDTSDPLSRVRHAVSPPASRVVRSAEQIEPMAEKYWDKNHGTHIAGMLASNNKDALGLLPDATISWIELGNPSAPIQEQMTQKDSNALRVINISQEFEDGSYDIIRKKLKLPDDPLVSKLLVIAVSDAGADLNKEDVKPPVAWSHQFPNLLTVSATDMQQKLLIRPQRVSTVDLKDPAGLAVKLRDAADSISQYLRAHLPADTQQLLQAYDSATPPSEALVKALVDALNLSLTDPDLYSAQRFAQLSLSEETRNLAAKGPQGEELIRLNRLLLEEAYPSEIARVPKYLVSYGVKYVDLLAPGYQIYSSTEDGAYAPATGTSQAAPLVTATAALLFKTIGGAVDPSLIKARLIYTADWEGRNLEERQNWGDQDSYLDKVWGGALNADRAISAYDHDIFLYEYGTGRRLRAIHNIPSHIKLHIKNWNSGEAFFVVQPGDPDVNFTKALTDADQQIDFDQVLRLMRLKNNLYRIIYKNKSGELRVIMNASIEGAFKYRVYEDKTDGTFKEQPILPTPETISLDKIIDYIGDFSKMGTKIKISF
jgi:subtilisin family serine protease